MRDRGWTWGGGHKGSGHTRSLPGLELAPPRVTAGAPTAPLGGWGPKAHQGGGHRQLGNGCQLGPHLVLRWAGRQAMGAPNQNTSEWSCRRLRTRGCNAPLPILLSASSKISTHHPLCQLQSSSPYPHAPVHPRETDHTRPRTACATTAEDPGWAPLRRSACKSVMSRQYFDREFWPLCSTALRSLFTSRSNVNSWWTG